MQIMDILTRPLGSSENRKHYSFLGFSALYIFIAIILGIVSLKTDSVKIVAPLMVFLSVQLVLTYSYADLRVASVKKELLKEQEEIKFTLKAMEMAKQLNKCQK